MNMRAWNHQRFFNAIHVGAAERVRGRLDGAIVANVENAADGTGLIAVGERYDDGMAMLGVESDPLDPEQEKDYIGRQG